jgi:hypothetical protein
MLGRGYPDLTVMSKSGIIVLLEIKNGNAKLTESEIKFHDNWVGSAIHVVRDENQALEILEFYDRQSIAICPRNYRNLQQVIRPADLNSGREKNKTAASHSRKKQKIDN